jgi:hypothetical protein
MRNDLDAAHLRELAEKCRRIALSLSETDATSLKQMAREYEVLADREDRPRRVIGGE